MQGTQPLRTACFAVQSIAKKNGAEEVPMRYSTPYPRQVQVTLRFHETIVEGLFRGRVTSGCVQFVLKEPGAIVIGLPDKRRPHPGERPEVFARWRQEERHKGNARVRFRKSDGLS